MIKYCKVTDVKPIKKQQIHFSIPFPILYTLQATTIHIKITSKAQISPCEFALAKSLLKTRQFRSFSQQIALLSDDRQCRLKPQDMVHTEKARHCSDTTMNTILMRYQHYFCPSDKKKLTNSSVTHTVSKRSNQKVNKIILFWKAVFIIRNLCTAVMCWQKICISMCYE